MFIMVGYVLGSVPTGYILGSAAGVDIRKAGSGNIGATNVARVVGKGQGVLTLIADAAKGFIPVVLAAQLGAAPMIVALAGVAAFIGHLYPVFLRFKGGKGAATALGVFLALAPLAAAILILIFAAVMLSSRIVSVGSMVTAAAAPLVVWAFDYPPVVTFTALFIGAAVVFRHRSNIRRLMEGTEPRLGSANSR